MADKPGVPEQLGQRGEEARRRQFQCLAVEMALRRMADENRILRTGQADIEQTPLFRERVRIDSAAGVAVKQRIRAGEGQGPMNEEQIQILPGTQAPWRRAGS